MISRATTVVQTDRHVYVFKTGLTGKPSGILYKASLGTATAEIAGGRLTSYLLVGNQKIWLNVSGQIQSRARTIVTAATDGAAARTTPTSSGAAARA